MIDSKSIAVVVPAWNVEDRIAKVLTTMPSFVDHVFVVDDCSRDRTGQVAQDTSVPYQVHVVRHERNLGVGAAIVTGYRHALKQGADAVAVMAGDGQMDPAELRSICQPVVDGQVDYVKGNRLLHTDVRRVMPRYRFIGNAVLSLLTKLASGYWRLMDFQTGYTAISREMLGLMPVDKLYPRYGFPNDVLVKLNVLNARVREIPIRPVYDGQSSNIRLGRVVPTISWILIKGFFWRIREKYIIRDFHPLVFFYLFGLVAFAFGLLFGLYLVVYRLAAGPVSGTSALFAALFFLSGSQSLFFAMWFDMESNRELQR